MNKEDAEGSIKNMVFSARHITISFASGAILGGIISGLSIALYFQSHAPSKTDSALFAQPLPRAIEQPLPRAIEQPLPRANEPPTQSAEDSVSNYFINKDVPPVVPLDTPKDQAKSVMLAELKRLPSIDVGSGKNEIYVLFDPLCTHCHLMHKTLVEGGAAKKYDLKAHFIPARIFLDKQASLTSSLYMTDLMVNGKNSSAQEFFIALMKKEPLGIPNNWVPSALATKTLDVATMALLQSGHGTPMILFRNKNTRQLEAIAGEPDDVDYNDMGPI